MKDMPYFELGIDCIPDWFMDRVSTNQIILHGTWGHLDGATVKTSAGAREFKRGDIVKIADVADGEVG